ncbi:hypothetical protein EVAR_85033_1 [Eumeta japonica]|uniref:Uncharacterized protein n=1 Tax=Eumeta variegata TaxID=151549 RepID=A0A4C1W8Q1_EUMVA|nr:hypothetical protein EVAR_85033_1 [Eumeta japonica]
MFQAREISARRSLTAAEENGGAWSSLSPTLVQPRRLRRQRHLLRTERIPCRAIMRRQYAEALKYCRLILQYEPQNTAARGFYPLLLRRAAHRAPHTDTSPSDGTSGSSLEVDSSSTSASGTRDELDDGEDDGDLNGNALFRTASYTGATLLVDENDNAAAATAPSTPGHGRRPRR